MIGMSLSCSLGLSMQSSAAVWLLMQAAAQQVYLQQAGLVQGVGEGRSYLCPQLLQVPEVQVALQDLHDMTHITQMTHSVSVACLLHTCQSSLSKSAALSWT